MHVAPNMYSKSQLSIHIQQWVLDSTENLSWRMVPTETRDELQSELGYTNMRITIGPVAGTRCQ